LIKVLLDSDEACFESLLTIVLELNNQLGTGRLYIP
jgi:hypothetical protein